MAFYCRSTKRKNYILIVLLVSLLSLACLAEEETPSAPPSAIDLTGEWRVLLKNSNGYKQLRFSIEEKNMRPRGKMRSYEFGEQDLDGKREEDGTIQFWSTYIDRIGASSNTSFTCKLEGETIVGKGEYMDKPYELKATRIKPKKKR